MLKTPSDDVLHDSNTAPAGTFPHANASVASMADASSAEAIDTAAPAGTTGRAPVSTPASRLRSLSVMVVGIRGLPGVQGGIETHAEELYPRLAALGCDIEVLTRSPFVPRGMNRHGALRLTRLWAPKTPGLEAFVHTLLGVLYAGWRQPDVLHIHAVGPALTTPLARLLGLRVVVTHHGPDYDREKWGSTARRILRLGERLGMRWANRAIVISRVIAEQVDARYRCDPVIIPNGVNSGAAQSATDLVERHGLEPGRYFLQVSRVVPEKRQLDLIDAWARLEPRDWRLVIVGGLGDDAYSQRVRDAAAAHGVVLTGVLYREALWQFYSHAGCFVLPSSHEGLPIALLEALSFGLPVIASDIAPHLELGMTRDVYFPCGNVIALTQRLAAAQAAPFDAEACTTRREWVLSRYVWDRVAHATLQVYRSVLDDRMQPAEIGH